MRSSLLATVFLIAMGDSVQIALMDLEEVIPITGTILVIRVDSLETHEGDGWCSADYSMLVLDTIRGSSDTDNRIECSYHLNLPRTLSSASGPVTWVSSWETGSGHEFHVSAGDTVIALIEEDHADSGGSNTLLRIEPMSMLDRILEELDIAAADGSGFFRGYMEIQAGEEYKLGFQFSGERWRSQELIESPSGTVLIWNWTNAGEWKDILSMTADTLIITLEVVDVRDIEYRSVLLHMPERWKRIYDSRIIDVSALRRRDTIEAAESFRVFQ